MKEIAVIVLGLILVASLGAYLSGKRSDNSWCEKADGVMVVTRGKEGACIRREAIIQKGER
jgi:hypothetical protein